MIDTIPVTNKGKWENLSHESTFNYYYKNDLDEVIYGVCGDNLYKHNYYVKYLNFVPKGLEGIEIRWNYNIFKNE